MATTSDQNSRTAAAWTDFEMKFFVGADRMLGDIDLTAGSTYDPDASTTLSAAVGHSEEDTITVVSTTGFSTGFIVIHPEAAGEAYEIIAYSGTTSTTFTGLTRYESDPDKRIHSSGATVSEWMDVTNFIYDAVDLELHQDEEISDWTASIRGHTYYSTIFQPDRAFLAMWRFRPYNGSMSSWTSWLVAFIGYMQDIDVSGDWEQANDWTAKIVSLAYYAKKTDIGSGTTYGKIDLAEGKTVEVSSYLVDAYQEAGSGEFLGSPDLDGDKAVDADISTLWISDGEPAPTVETPQSSAGCINEVYLRAEPWMPSGLQWIELFWKSTQGMWPAGFGGCQLCTSYTTWAWAGWSPDGRTPVANYLDLPKTPSIEIGDTWFGIFTNNKAAFMAYFPQCQADVYDWRPLEVGTFTLDETGDALLLRWWGIESIDAVWWDGGRASWALYDIVGGGSHYYDMPGTNYSGWTGSMITVPPVGHSFRKDPTGKKTFYSPAGAGGTPGIITDYETDEDHPTPGYAITGEPEYIIVDLGTLGISLEAPLAQYYTVKAELDGHLGLTDGPAYVSLDTGGGSNEIVLYQTIDRVNNEILDLTRGQAGTSDIAHAAGESVQQYESGAATDNHLIQTIRWKRRPVLIGGVYDVPFHFDVYSTAYAAGYPKPDEEEWDDGLGSGGWEDYWDRLASARYYTQTSWQKTLTTSNLRARKVMIAIKKMRAAGRVKLNSMYVYGPAGHVLTAGTEDDQWEAGFSTGIISHLLQTWLTIDSASITETAMGRQIYKLDVTQDRIIAALRDICKSAGTIIYFRLDNTVEIDWNTLLGVGGWPDVYFYWTRSNSRTIRFSRKTQTAIAQVVVRLTNPEEEETFEAAWPSVPFLLGEVIEEDDRLLVGDEDDAVATAEMLYNYNRLTDTTEIVAKGIAEWVLPGQRHVVTYDIDGDGTYLGGHNVVVTNVRHSISLGAMDGSGKEWRTSITARRVEYA